MRLRVIGALLVFCLVLGLSGITFATNSIKTQFNTRYGTAGSAIDQCILCHAVNSGADIPSTETPPNPYGVALENNGRNFAAAEPSDSDGDGFTNIAEITARTFPGNAASKPAGSDTTLPTVSAFTVPATSASLTVPITSLVATDNVGVTGFLVNESATKPLATAAGWSATAPASYTAATAGAKTLYAWAKDAAGNVSASRSASVTITVTGPPTARTIVDFDGDGKTDIAFYRSSAGVWYITPSSGAAAYGVGWGGDSSDIPAPGDYDGDGKIDIAIYRAATGAWYITPSSGAAAYGVGWGGSGFTGVPGDYDGDGKTDVAIYQASTGAWWIKPSSGAASYGIGWGGSGFTPVPGDYDGDGKTDAAIYQASTGAWWIKPSSGAASYGVGWGGDPADEPAPGDYDGDGKDDIAVYHVSTGAWYIHPSSGAADYGVGFGGDATDIPVTLNCSIY